MWITGSNLILRNVCVGANFAPYTSAIHWFSQSATSPASNDRIYGLSLNYAQSGAFGLVFGSVSNPSVANRNGDFIYGAMFYDTDICILMNQPDGALSVNGGDICCDAFGRGSGYSEAASLCYNVENGNLTICNCELLKCGSQQGYAFEGPATITGCHIEAACNWYLNPGNTTLTDVTGLQLNANASFFTLTNSGGCQCVISNCYLARGSGVGSYSTTYMIGDSSGGTCNFLIRNTVLSEWKQAYLSNCNANIRMTNVSFPSDSGTHLECERQLWNGTTVTSGIGSPQGVVPALVGSLYLRADGGSGTCFYVKESGSGNTG